MFIFGEPKILNLMWYYQTGVYKYLIYLQKYLLGDLSKFDELSVAAEKQELSDAKAVNRAKRLMPTTTLNPATFEFHHNKFIISRSTIPHSQSLFSTIDILGYLICTGSDYTRTNKNFTAFFNKTLHLKPNELEVLVFIYRHGITHSYFPILNTGIAYHTLNESKTMFYKDERGDLVLNVKYLKKSVISGLEQIIADQTLYSNMENQYQDLIKNLESKNRKRINKLKSKL